MRVAARHVEIVHGPLLGKVILGDISRDYRLFVFTVAAADWADWFPAPSNAATV